MNLSSFWNKSLYVFTILCSFSLVLVCTLYFTGVSKWPLIGIIAMITPVFFLCNLICAVYWLLKRDKVFIFPLISIIISLLVLGPIYKFPTNKTKITQNEVRIMSFNSRDFNKYQQIDQPDLDQKIVAMVGKQDPDIVCFQEFNIRRREDFTKYPYRYVNYLIPEEQKVIQAIYSKFPIKNKGFINFPQSSNHTIFADILIGEELIRVYNVHLQSFNIYPSIRAIASDPRRQFFGRIHKSLMKREEQAELVKAHYKSSNLRSVICADLNSTAFSYTYRMVKGNLKDSYEECGQGLGTTFRFLKYPFRIDFIFTDPTIEIVKHQIVRARLSDHYPVVASIKLNAD